MCLSCVGILAGTGLDKPNPASQSVSAEAALERGLAIFICESGELVDKSMGFANGLANQPSVAY